MNRRQFFIGLGAGLVLPRFFDKVFSFIENHEEPLLWAPESATETMYAVMGWSDYNYGYQLNLGDIDAAPPMGITVREFCKLFAQGDHAQWCFENEMFVNEHGLIDWNRQVPDCTVMDFWVPQYSSCNIAGRYIDSINLGPQLVGDEAVGELKRQAGGPCSDLDAYQAVDAVSLSLLQNRLNEINSGYRIEVVMG